MELSEATQTLARAGKSAELIELLDQEADRVARRYAEIRQDRTRSQDGQRWLLAVAYQQARLGLEKRLSDMAGSAVRTDRDDAERVFGVKGLPGDAASLVISRRDAADRVANASGSELRELLGRATRSGDEVLARAVAERAVEVQDATTMNLFLRDRPELDAAGERLWNASRATNESMHITMRLAALRPAELWGMDSDSIYHLAAKEPTGAST